MRIDRFLLGCALFGSALMLVVLSVGADAGAAAHGWQWMNGILGG